jgi:hypothetical protein
MKENIEKLANIWANRRAEDPKLGIVYTFSEKALDTFVEQIQTDHTKYVVKLCANTINNNLNDQARRKRNNYEVLELIIIIGAMIAWAAWWYTNAH